MKTDKKDKFRPHLLKTTCGAFLRINDSGFGKKVSNKERCTVFFSEKSMETVISRMAFNGMELRAVEI